MQEALEATMEKLSEDIHKFMQLSESSQHIYNMSSILHKKVIFESHFFNLLTK